MEYFIICSLIFICGMISGVGLYNHFCIYPERKKKLPPKNIDEVGNYIVNLPEEERKKYFVSDTATMLMIKRYVNAAWDEREKWIKDRGF